jgi:crotonobetainyl-CoA:carnitine CoA-transferase CaiB-like acyl-CoA transferase
LTDDKGFLCGRILGDLGADVIKVESPGGDPSRRIGPYYKDIPHPERSLYWFAFNANKRGITLNLHFVDGQEIFKKLIKKADILIESFHPGYMETLGLSYEELSKINPSLVMTSITPFGQGGPYRDFEASDLVSWCMGGMAYVSGDPDRSPVQISFPQAYLQASAVGATGTLIALYYRELTGEGQMVDVSIHEAVVCTLMNVPQFWDVSGIILKRAGIFRTGLSTSANQRLIWRCKDGYINFPIFGGIQGAYTNASLARWMEEEGIGDEYLNNFNWKEFNMAEATQDQFERFEGPISNFFRSHTMDELYRGAIKRGIMLYPVYTVKEIKEDLQLNARVFWEEIHHPELNEILIYPGSPLIFCCERSKICRRAPLIGEHNEEIYCGELGYSKNELIVFRQTGVI